MTMGLKTYELEKNYKNTWKKHAILTTSGTSAITMASLAIGLKPVTKLL